MSIWRSPIGHEYSRSLSNVFYDPRASLKSSLFLLLSRDGTRAGAGAWYSDMVHTHAARASSNVRTREYERKPPSLCACSGDRIRLRESVDENAGSLYNARRGRYYI